MISCGRTPASIVAHRRGRSTRATLLCIPHPAMAGRTSMASASTCNTGGSRCAARSRKGVCGLVPRRRGSCRLVGLKETCGLKFYTLTYEIPLHDRHSTYPYMYTYIQRRNTDYPLHSTAKARYDNRAKITDTIPSLRYNSPSQSPRARGRRSRAPSDVPSTRAASASA